MAANRSVFILDSVRNALDANALFTVHKVHRPSFNADVNCYAYIVTQTVGDVLEDGAGDSTGTCTVGILFDARVQSDPQNQGLGTAKYGEIVQAAEDALANWESAIISSKPSDTHTGGLFKTVITGFRFIGWDGHWDTGGNGIAVGAQLDINYLHIAL